MRSLAPRSTLIVIVSLAAVLLQVSSAAAAGPPLIYSESVSNLTATDATFEAEIEPSAGHNAYYQFQLAKNPSEFASEFTCPTENHSSLCLGITPQENALPIGSVCGECEIEPAVAPLDLANAGITLEPGTTYHYRVIAATAVPTEDTIEWEEPTIVGTSHLFTTPTIASESLSMTFTEARANVGVQLSDAALFAPPDTAPLAAQIDPGGRITAGVLQAPEFKTHVTGLYEGDVTVDFEIGIISGSFDQPAGQWTDMHAAPIGGDTSFCNNVEGRIEGAGGVWLQQTDIVPPSAPQLTGTDPPSPSASGAPRILGSAEAGSTVRLYSGPGCSGTPLATAPAANLASPGLVVEVGEGTTASFSATATDAAANTSPCSAPISYTHLKSPGPPAACIVPKLAGMKLGRAKEALKSAGCALGKVSRPKHRKRRKPGHLVVKSSRPSAGTTLPLGTRVNLRLGLHSHRNAHRFHRASGPQSMTTGR
jgi:PASTA domain